MSSGSSARLNLAEAICHRHADSVTRVALLDIKHRAENGYTFGGLDYLSDKFACTLRECGIAAGDAVAIILDQSAALVVAQLGALKLGATAVLLSPALAPGDIEWAINDSRAKALVAPFEKRADYVTLAQTSSINVRFVAGDSRDAIHYDGPERSFWRDVFVADSDFTPDATEIIAPAFVFYTKTTDGNLRRINQSHADTLQSLSAFKMKNHHRQDVREGDTLWCADDWASSDLLLNLIYPMWWRGNAVVTKSPDGLTAESALQIFQRCDVTMAFVQENLLNDLLCVNEQERKKFDLKLRTIIRRSDSLTADHYQRTKALLGATLYEIDGKLDSGQDD